jgi:intracellular sulfur oxidation DsrE/DsrF family protein
MTQTKTCIFHQSEGTNMKRIFPVLLLTLFGLGTLFAQRAPYRVVFDLTSRDTLDQMVAVRWVKEVTKADPNAMVEVVMYGKGFELVMPEKSRFIAEVKEASKNPNVSFTVCEVALRNNKVERAQVLQEVHTVPDGIYEIVSKQHEGWGYIKVVH